VRHRHGCGGSRELIEDLADGLLLAGQVLERELILAVQRSFVLVRACLLRQAVAPGRPAEGVEVIHQVVIPAEVLQGFVTELAICPSSAPRRSAWAFAADCNWSTFSGDSRTRSIGMGRLRRELVERGIVGGRRLLDPQRLAGQFRCRSRSKS